VPTQQADGLVPPRSGHLRSTTPTRRRPQSANSGLIAALIAAVLVLGSSLFFLRQYYADRAMPGTYLDGIDISGLTQAQIQAIAQTVAAQWTVTLTYDGRSIQANAADLGIVPDPAETATRVLASGHATPITQRYDRRAIKQNSLVTTIDDDVAEEFIATHFPTVEAPSTQPAVTFDQETTTFTVAPGVAGQTLDTTALLTLLDQIRQQTGQPATYDVPVVAAPPAIPDDQAEAAALWANARLALPLSLTHDDETIATFDAATIATWVTIVVDDTTKTITAGVDETAVATYLTGTVDAGLVDPAHARVTLNDAAGTEVWVLEEGAPNPSIADPAAVAHNVATALVTEP